MKRLAIVAHWDPRGDAASHFLRFLDTLRPHFQDVIIASTSDLSPSARRRLAAKGELFERPNVGQDFGSWADVLRRSDFAQDYDELLLTNDTFVGLLRPMERIAAEMERRMADVWGITASTRFTPHIQSYFVYFTSPALHSIAFDRFWRGLTPATGRMNAIMTQEVGLSKAFSDAGFRLGAYFKPTRAERLRANRRGRRRMLLRNKHWPHVFPTLDDPYFDFRARRDLTQSEALNAAIVFADSVFDDARLPLVKFDSLRFDSNWLGTEELLAGCERRFPAEFAGVRKYLDATDAFYPARPHENKASVNLWPYAKFRVGFSSRKV